MNIVIVTIWIGAHTYHQPHVIPSQSSIPASAASNLDRAEEHVLCVLHEHGKTVELLLLEVLCDSNRHVMQSAYQIHQKSAAVMTVLFFVPNSNRLHLHYPRGYITVPKIKKQQQRLYNSSKDWKITSEVCTKFWISIWKNSQLLPCFNQTNKIIHKINQKNLATCKSYISPHMQWPPFGRKDRKNSISCKLAQIKHFYVTII